MQAAGNPGNAIVPPPPTRPVLPVPTSLEDEQLRRNGLAMMEYYTQCLQYNTRVHGPMQAPVDTFGMPKQFAEGELGRHRFLVRTVSVRESEFATPADYELFAQGLVYNGPAQFQDESNRKHDMARLRWRKQKREEENRRERESRKRNREEEEEPAEGTRESN